MKARCNVCGKEIPLENIGRGVYKTNKEMEEHQKEHTEKIVWELVPDIGDTVITTEPHEQLAEAHSDTEQALIEDDQNNNDDKFSWYRNYMRDFTTHISRILRDKQEKTKGILIECARIYNRVWREALGERDYNEVSIEETEIVEDEAHEEIRDFLEREGVEDWEFIDVHCNCSEIPFPCDEVPCYRAMIGVGTTSSRGFFVPGVRVRDRTVCLRCGTIHFIQPRLINHDERGRE